MEAECNCNFNEGERLKSRVQEWLRERNPIGNFDGESNYGGNYSDEEILAEIPKTYNIDEIVGSMKDESRENIWYIFKYYQMDRGDISVFTILATSPFDLFEREDEKESFVEVIKHTIAPYYKFKSLTTILITIMIIIYITLVFMYPPFLRVPTFAAQPL